MTSRINPRVVLGEIGTAVISHTCISKFASDEEGVFLWINSSEISPAIVSCSVSEITSNSHSYGGAVCIRNSKESSIAQTTFFHNFCFSCPDFILWEFKKQHIEKARLNRSECFRSFCEDLMNCIGSSLNRTVSEFNSSSNEGAARSDGICISVNVSPCRVSYMLIDRCSKGKGVLEIAGVDAGEIFLDSIIITNSSSYENLIRREQLGDDTHTVHIEHSAIFKNSGMKSFGDALLAFSIKSTFITDNSCPPPSEAGLTTPPISFESAFIRQIHRGCICMHTQFKDKRCIKNININLILLAIVTCQSPRNILNSFNTRLKSETLL